MRVYLGADHAGFQFKNELADHLRGLGHEVVDVGPHAYDAEDDYPAFCIEAASRVVADHGSVGVVIGGSGNGEQIAANKVPGARVALAWSPETARLARNHNNAQLIGVGARMHTTQEAIEIVTTFLDATFSDEQRHSRRIGLIAEYESTGTPPPLPTG
ncbi:MULTISPECIES: ribose-5-phosphate isomerase [Actinoalloteichus]|uniref:Ribose-5-phosphate isomerase B n=1 Tax=Actinoalloteichus fjordicus TaxID=1612552 RepID=A0AAC9L9G7_9PSEU|nr:MULTISPECIES: ribose-5-phosphate isomerase [Actinoalloteichus]APU13663.1 ribose 5-phosphate isomerase [Actinoalloteichus fjordicus]APU19609.1 ribose 5-phosphate isomerase [Actinoalloteichus sp. GBA129-24]